MSQPSLRGDSVGRSSSVVYYNLDNSVGSDWSSLRESQGNMFISHLKIKEIAIKLSLNTEVHVCTEHYIIIMYIIIVLNELV